MADSRKVLMRIAGDVEAWLEWQTVRAAPNQRSQVDYTNDLIRTDMQKQLENPDVKELYSAYLKATSREPLEG